MIAVVMGLGAALAYGLGDFIAGRLSRALHYAVVALIGNVVSLGATIVALALSAPATPTSDALLWGVVSGADARDQLGGRTRTVPTMP